MLVDLDQELLLEALGRMEVERAPVASRGVQELVLIGAAFIEVEADRAEGLADRDLRGRGQAVVRQVTGERERQHAAPGSQLYKVRVQVPSVAAGMYGGTITWSVGP